MTATRAPAAAGAGVASPRPFGITLIAGYYALACLATIPSRQSGVLVIGFPAVGWFALLHDVAIALAALYAAVGLWRLREGARRVAIGLQWYFLLNLLVCLLNPSTREEFSEFISHVAVDPVAARLLFTTTYVILAILASVVLWGLVISKPVCSTRAQSEPTP